MEGNREGQFQNFVSPFLIRECTEGAVFNPPPCRNWSEMKAWMLEMNLVKWVLQFLACTIAELTLSDARKAAQKGQYNPTELVWEKNIH